MLIATLPYCIRKHSHSDHSKTAVGAPHLNDKGLQQKLARRKEWINPDVVLQPVLLDKVIQPFNVRIASRRRVLVLR